MVGSSPTGDPIVLTQALMMLLGCPALLALVLAPTDSPPKTPKHHKSCSGIPPCAATTGVAPLLPAADTHLPLLLFSGVWGLSHLGKGFFIPSS